MEIEVWNVRNRTVEGIPRTQNQVEGWHRGIQSMFDGNRPTIWSFLAGLQREQVLQHGELVQLRAGGQGRRISRVSNQKGTHGGKLVSEIIEEN